MNQTRRSLFHSGLPAAAATAAAASGVLAACGAPGAGDAKPVATQAPVMLRHASGVNNVGFYAVEKKVTQAFNAKGGPITVTIESPNPLYAAVLAQAAAGTPPDLSIAHPRDSRPLLDGGALLTLDGTSNSRSSGPWAAICGIRRCKTRSWTPGTRWTPFSTRPT